MTNHEVNFYTIDATGIAAEVGLGNRTSTVLQAAFFKLAGVLPIDEAEEYMKNAAIKTFSRKGEKIVNMNLAAIERGLENVVKIEVPAEWAELKDEEKTPDASLPHFVSEVLIPMNSARGDNIPVSTMMPLSLASTSSNVQDRRAEFWHISRADVATPPALEALPGAK